MMLIVVDDEPIVLRVLERAVREAEPESEVYGFESANEALKAIEHGLQPDAVFLDMEMFPMSGLELAKCIREISPAIKIAFVTGYPGPAAEEDKIHGKGYLHKPVTAQMVREELILLEKPFCSMHGRVQIRTFGEFDIFIDEKLMYFNNPESKEILAYLVDRRGAWVNIVELGFVLQKRKANFILDQLRIQSFVKDLCRSLLQMGIGNILLKKNNSFSLDCKVPDCDLYRFLHGDPAAVNMYTGEYMKQYDWAVMKLVPIQFQK